jgi:putative CocE/NonD family hydrolase
MKQQMFETMVPMRDGIRLHTFVYLPDPKVWPHPYPAIVQRIPYGIGEPGILPGLNMPSAPGLPSIILRGWKGVVTKGYASVFQDTRGRFGSEGTDRVYFDDGIDGYDTMEWVAAQPWCNGRVGMAGSSAGGITSYATAAQNPPHLFAIFAQAASANLYNEVVYEGQALEWERLPLWFLGHAHGLSSSHIHKLRLPDQKLQEVMDQGKMIYNDLKSHVLNPVESKWWMHLPLLDYPAISLIQPFWNEVLSHPTQDNFRDNHDFKGRIEIPAIHVTTWYDIFFRSTLEAFTTIQKRGGHQKLFIGPGDHYAVYSPNFWPYDPFFLWFDYWLKGIDTGIMDAPPIYYYHMGTEKWRYADEWPPSGVECKTYYFHHNGLLSADVPTSEEFPRSYVYNPHNPVQTVGGRNLQISKGSLDQRPVEPPYRTDVLLYKSEVLSHNVEIAGNVKVNLHASSTCKDTDFTAKLIDVHPDGSTMLVLDGVTRAIYRESPRHPVPMKPGKTYEFTIDIGDTSHVFKAGHQIQLDISSSNFPRRARNTNSGNLLYTGDSEMDIVIATNTIYHKFDFPSYLVLPVLPQQKPNVFEGTSRIKRGKAGYKGLAELYQFPTAFFLNFEGRWVKWKIIKSWQKGSVEYYKCEGSLGKLSILIQTKDQAAFEAVATGGKAYFKGWIK